MTTIEDRNPNGWTATRRATLHDLIDALRWIAEKDGFPVHGGHRERDLVEVWEKRLARAEDAVRDRTMWVVAHPQNFFGELTDD